MLIKMTKFHDLTSHSPSYYKIISPCGRHSIPLSRRCSFYFFWFEWAGSPEVHMAGLSGVSVIQTKKRRIPPVGRLSPSQSVTKGGNRIE